ncbi:C-type lectin lectoxin-Thr1-like [Amphiura filiformis]|uniref:C-type lectin lectoxin-Thr1-like n=1 Tax=Amphiura filiformis TaxID=82378 RepID=UPI003B220FE0
MMACVRINIFSDSPDVPDVIKDRATKTIDVRVADSDDTPTSLITKPSPVITNMPTASECYSNALGRDYRGSVHQTIDGTECQSWTSHDPHEHRDTFIPENHPYAGLGEHNYCRNPSGDDGPWCYTTDPGTRWEYCPVGLASIKCDTGVNCSHEWQGSCYNYVAISLPWSDAEIYCNNQYGAHLVSIHSSDENSFISGLSGSDKMWIGLSDRATEGTFEWSDGSQVDYTNWHSEAPDNGGDGEHCAHIYDDFESWNDSSCFSKMIFICKT